MTNLSEFIAKNRNVTSPVTARRRLWEAGLPYDDASIAKALAAFAKHLQRRLAAPRHDPLLLAGVKRYRNLRQLKIRKEWARLPIWLQLRASDRLKVLEGPWSPTDAGETFKRAIVHAVAQRLRDNGAALHHISDAGSVYLKYDDGSMIRISDHELPPTPERSWRAAESNRFLNEIIVTSRVAFIYKIEDYLS